MRAIKVKAIKQELKNQYRAAISPNMFRKAKRNYTRLGTKRSQQPKLRISKRQERVSQQQTIVTTK